MKLLVSLLFFTSFAALAGEAGPGSGGGGGFVRTANNPWFVQNTKEVRYCLKIDERNFSLSKSLASQRIRDAISYWLEQFKISRDLYPMRDALQLGTQSFLEVDCASDIDLEFLLGVLPEAPPAGWIPTSWLGITVRTDYDNVNLRGKGFIYISPENGPLKFKNKNVLENVWSSFEGHLFRILVMHELGHLFGFQHRNVSGMDLMNHNFPELLVRKDTFKNPSPDVLELIKNYKPAQFKFEPGPYPYVVSCSAGTPPKIGGIDFNIRAREFLAMDDPKKCLTYSINKQRLEFFAVENKLGQPSKRESIGYVDLEWELEDRSYRDAETHVMMWLPEEQKVITKERWSSEWMGLAFGTPHVAFRGIYLSRDGKIKREVWGRGITSSGWIELSGKIGDKVYLRIEI